MNPLADLLAVPLWQFHIIYGFGACFAALFALHLRWEARQVDGSPGPGDAAELARGPGATRSPEVVADLQARGLILTPAAIASVRAAVLALTLTLAAVAGARLWRAQAQGQSLVGLAAELAATLAGGAALAVAPQWLTAPGAALLAAEKRA